MDRLFENTPKALGVAFGIGIATIVLTYFFGYLGSVIGLIGCFWFTWRAIEWILRNGRGHSGE